MTVDPNGSQRIDVAKAPGDAARLVRIWDAERCSLLREVNTGMSCCAAITALGMRRGVAFATWVDDEQRKGIGDGFEAFSVLASGGFQSMGALLNHEFS